MGTRIKLQTCFALNNSESELLELPKEIVTLRNLLSYLGGKINYSFMDSETGSIEDDLEIRINNKEVWFYPSALDTRLENNDLVEIYLIPLGGG